MILLFLFTIHAFAAEASGPAEAAYSVGSPPLESMEQVNSDKITAYSNVCGTLGLDASETAQAKALLGTIPPSAPVCSEQRVRLKQCLEK